MAANLPEDLYDRFDAFVEGSPRLRKRDVVCAALWMFLEAEIDVQNEALRAIQERYYLIQIRKSAAGSAPSASAESSGIGEAARHALERSLSRETAEESEGVPRQRRA